MLVFWHSARFPEILITQQILLNRKENIMKKKLTLVSYSYAGKVYSYFIFASYDRNNKAKISTDVFMSFVARNGHLGKCITVA
jgi:hypothetical protein